MGYIGNVPAEKYTALTQQTFSSPTGTSFTLSQAVTNSVDIDLYIDNVKQDPTTYSVSGTALTTSTIASPSTMYCIYNGRTTETVNPPDDSVGLSQMASATDGNLITFDASGNPAYVATGSDGQVLTSAGAGQPCAFEALPVSGSLVRLGTAVASNSASLTITGLDSTYDCYLIVGSDIEQATQDAYPWLRFGDSSGVDTGSSDYSYHGHAMSEDSAAYAAYADAAHDAIALPLGGDDETTTHTGFHAWLYMPADSTSQPYVTGAAVGASPSGLRGGPFIGERQAAITLDRVNFLFSSGNITSGRLTVYGVAHA